jgi:hypothetical protein
VDHGDGLRGGTKSRSDASLARTSASTASSRRADDLAALDVELGSARAALDRYFRAFEEESLPIEACAPRIEELYARIAGFEARREELAIDADSEVTPLTVDEIRDLAAEARRVLDEGTRVRRRLSCRASCARFAS